MHWISVGRQQLYYQLYNLLFQDIISGKYPVGCIIPAESELMNTYHVSRATARKAMEMLANDGLVSKKRGYGIFVISAQPNTSPQQRSPLYKEKQSGSSYRRKTNDQSKSNESAQGYRGVSSAI